MNIFLKGSLKLFKYYKSLADISIERVGDDQIHYQVNSESNSIAIIMNHLSGNMISRFTDFLISDGEKSWRNRDAEFKENKLSKKELIEKWEQGWNCLFDTLTKLNDDDLYKIVFIRNEGHTVMEAIQRQIAHYAYHCGQIVFISKRINADNWKSLSIPKNGSQDFNKKKFSRDKNIKHFTDEE